MPPPCPHVNEAVGFLSERDLKQLMGNPKCDICRVQGRKNFWLCMYDGCYMLGCSDEDDGPDHSTKHYNANPSHCIQANITTKRAWCYECNKEICVPVLERLRDAEETARLASSEVTSSTSTGEVSTDMTSMGSTSSFGRPIKPNEDNSDEYVARPSSDDIFVDSKKRVQQHGEPGGLVGLTNLGNTCYMNAALQCLSNVPALTEFFLTCPALVGRVDLFNNVTTRDRPSLSKAYLGLVRELWSAEEQKPARRIAFGSAFVSPTKLLSSFKLAHPMFRGYHQQDSQEFLRCFMDQLHEELMEPASDLHDDEDDNPAEAASAQDLESVSEAGDHDASAHEPQAENEEEEEQEYETADSGVSEQSSNNSSTSAPPDPTPEQQPQQQRISSNGSRKRKHTNSGANGVEATAPSNSLGCQSQTLDHPIPGTAQRRRNLSLANEEEVVSPASDAELEYADAASSRSASPPSHGGYFSASMSSRGGGSTMAASKSPSKGSAAGSPTTSNSAVEAYIQKRRMKTYRSVISDIFDGKLVSSVQCLTCDRVSMTTETFQDLSLPIPTQEGMSTMRQPISKSPSSSTLSSLGAGGGADSGWLSWMWSWVSGWFYGPNITLQDCLAYFFSADELKGDNMYSCEKCKKLRNGLKYSRVTVLPDTLCIHLKRFRHEFAFSSKISTKVTFPLVDLDMSPWLHQDCISRESSYDLIGVICHHGTAGGGHYTAYALNNVDQEWYEYDDSFVGQVEPATVMAAEAYVLFYRKNNQRIEPFREEVQARLQQSSSLMQFYVSRQWLNKLENFAEPGPIDNSDFLCRHGGVLPTRSKNVFDLCVAFPQNAWDLLHSTFGGGPACTRLYECSHCRDELDRLNRQKEFELEEFKQLHAEFQESETPTLVMNCLSSSWFKQWENFVLGRQRDPPGPIDNKAIITTRPADRQSTLRPSSDYLQVSNDIWLLLHSIYGGGPEVLLRSNGTSVVLQPRGPSIPALSTRMRARTASESASSAVGSNPATSKL